MSRRTKRRLWLSARIVLAILIVGVAIVTFLPEINTNTWWIRFLSYPRFQFLCGLIALLILSLLLPDRARWPGIASSLVAAAALAFQCYVFMPWTPLEGAQVLPAPVCPDGNDLRLLEANVQMTNEHTHRLLDEIAAAKPDVVLVEEVDQWWHDHLAEIYDAYPYRKNYVTQNYYGITLLSKYPLVDPRIEFMAHSRDPAIFTGVKLPSGEVVQFYGIHPRPPTMGQSSAERDAEIMDTALRLGDRPGPSLLAGDLNATPWSPIVRRLARIGHLLDPRIGRGWFPTWKAHGVLLRWPLDNVLFTQQFTLGEFRVLPPFGSDHQPTLTTVCYTPKLADRQVAPKPAPGDIAVAKKAVAVGQGKAVPSPQPKPVKQEPGAGK